MVAFTNEVSGLHAGANALLDPIADFLVLLESLLPNPGLLIQVFFVQVRVVIATGQGVTIAFAQGNLVEPVPADINKPPEFPSQVPGHHDRDLHRFTSEIITRICQLR